MGCAAPLFVLVGAARHLILAPFGFDSQVEQLAAAFWFPRVGGACVGAAGWAMFGFFNGIGRPRVTLLITVVTTVANALLNQLFIFRLGWGIAGSAWATNVAQLAGLLFAVAIFLRSDYRRRYRAHLTWRPHGGALMQQLRLGVPMGLSPAADLLGFATFQMMQTRLGTAGGAATPMVVILTSLAYIAGFGIPSAGTTLVGQSIGAGARAAGARLRFRPPRGVGALPAEFRRGPGRGLGRGPVLRLGGGEPVLAARAPPGGAAVPPVRPAAPAVCSSR